MSPGWIFLGICVTLILYLGSGEIQMAIADIQKLIDNMKRAQKITEVAATDADKHSIIMDNFEKRLEQNRETMLKIDAYEKIMAQMDAVNNGGPALEATFSSSETGTRTSSSFDTKTGRQL